MHSSANKRPHPLHGSALLGLQRLDDLGLSSPYLAFYLSVIATFYQVGIQTFDNLNALSKSPEWQAA